MGCLTSIKLGLEPWLDQVERIDYTETFSLIVKPQIIKVILTLAL